MENCLECGDKLFGRSDKKFCNDGCRNAYNNRQNRDVTNLMRRVNKRLRDNYHILSELNFRDGKAKTTRSRLAAQNFDFEYFTRLKIYKNGSQYQFVYNIGYRYLEDDWILVVKRED